MNNLARRIGHLYSKLCLEEKWADYNAAPNQATVRRQRARAHDLSIRHFRGDEEGTLVRDVTELENETGFRLED